MSPATRALIVSQLGLALASQFTRRTSERPEREYMLVSEPVKTAEVKVQRTAEDRCPLLF